MALITGPLHSDDASGRFAGSLVFSKWKGRNYCRQLVTPANPQSAKQVGVRKMMRWLSQLWSGLTAGNKATWDELAAARDISGFNAFVGENLARWQLNTGPTNEFPAAETKTALSPAGGENGAILAATGHEGYASLSATPDGGDCVDAVGVILYRGDAIPTPKSWAKAIAIFAVTLNSEWSYDDTPLDAGTYHYKLAYFGNDGVIGDLSAADVEAVVT